MLNFIPSGASSRYHVEIQDFASDARLTWWLARQGEAVFKFLKDPEGSGVPRPRFSQDQSCMLVVHDEEPEPSAWLVSLWKFINNERLGADFVLELRLKLTAYDAPESACRAAIQYEWVVHRSFDFPRYRRIEERAPLNHSRSVPEIDVEQAFWWSADTPVVLAQEDSGVVSTSEDLRRWLSKLPGTVLPAWAEGAVVEQLNQDIRRASVNRILESLTALEVKPAMGELIAQADVPGLLRRIWSALEGHIQTAGFTFADQVWPPASGVLLRDPNHLLHQQQVSGILMDESEAQGTVTVQWEMRWSDAQQEWSRAITVDIRPAGTGAIITRNWYPPGRAVTRESLEDLTPYRQWLCNADLALPEWQEPLQALANRVLEQYTP